MKPERVKLCAAVGVLLFCAGVPAEASRSAKDMYFDQLEAPGEQVNTGFKYWIELKRSGVIKLVDNRFAFRSGDEIRFRVVPNLTGHAYVVLSKGTSGVQKVLFPNQREAGGKVVAGKTVVLPAKGYLRFDSTPGDELVRVVLSRQPLSSAALLEPGSSNWATIASSSSGAQTYGESTLVAFPDAENVKVDFSNEGKPPDESSAKYAKDLDYVAPATPTRRTSRVRVPSRRTVRRSPNRTQADPLAAAMRPGGVTVINIEPSENLGADIHLNHR
ncbi:MAG: DUF4384 domain-containing protein [Candidatus Obscuribacterales bacterium]|nr:DUF4384 domain-containing protein [Candidatus Obscuribacterales bacterium]